MIPPNTPSQTAPPDRLSRRRGLSPVLFDTSDTRSPALTTSTGNYNSDDEHSAYSLAHRKPAPRYAVPQYLTSSSPMQSMQFEQSRSPYTFATQSPIPFGIQSMQAPLTEESRAPSRSQGRSDNARSTTAATDETATPNQGAGSAASEGGARQPPYTSAEDRILTTVLVGVVTDGAAPDNNFKRAHYQKLAEAINVKIPGRQRDWKFVKNRHGYLKRTYFVPLKNLKEMSGSGWNEERGEVLLDDDVWESIRSSGQADRYAMRGKSWALYADWETMYEGRTAHGGEVITPGKPTARKVVKNRRQNNASDDEEDGDNDEDSGGKKSRGNVEDSGDGEEDSSA